MTSNNTQTNSQPRPLDGVRVIEVGQLVAGPFAGTLLAYFGAEVVKVEPPGAGDPIRGWRLLDDTGTSYWWHSLGRNKKSVTANLRSDAGRELVRRLIDSADVLIENFKPGSMERWGLVRAGASSLGRACWMSSVRMWAQDSACEPNQRTSWPS